MERERGRLMMSKERWTNAGGPLLEVDGTFASWETRAMQRIDGPSRKSHVFHERSRYPDVLETDETKDTEFERIQRHKRHTAKKDIGRLQASYLQPRDQWPNYVGTHRRVQRYPKATRWTPRYYTSDPIRTEAGYLIHEHGENEESQENARNIRQRSSAYHEPLQRFAKVSHNLYEYDKPRHENDATFSAYSETVDVTNENARPNGAPEVLEQYHQFMHRPQTSRRTFKRPLGKMQRDVTSPPTIYRHRVPYSSNYMFDDDNNDWMTEDEEMDGDYGYPPHFGPVEVPVVRRSRHFESTNAQQWSGPAGRGLQQMYKRRRRSQEDISLNNEMTDDITFETRNHEHVSSPSPNIRTVVVGPLDNVTDNADGVGAFPDHTDTFAGNRAEEGSTPSSSSSSVVHTDSADLEFGQNHVTNAVPSQLAVDELVASNVNKDAESSTRETLSEEEDESANEEDLQLTSDNATAKEHPIEHTLQTEVVPLDSDASIREATAFLSPRRSAAITNFPTRVRDTPESCVASSVSSVVKDTDHSAMNAMELSAGTSEENQTVSVGPEVLLEKELPVQAPSFSESSVQYDYSLNEGKPAESTVGSIVTDTIRINNYAIASLEQLNEVEADFMIAKTSLSTQGDKLRQVESSSKSCRRMEILCGIVYDLQCHVDSRSCGLKASRKQTLLGQLDNCLELISIRNERTLQERVDKLQASLEHFLAMDIPFVDDRVVVSKTEAVELNVVSNSNSIPSLRTEVHDDRPDDANNSVWEDDDWFEEGAFDDLASESDEQDDVVAQISSEKSNLKFGGDFLAVKMGEGASSRWPRELPPFVWSLLARVTSSDPQSYVVRVTLKRLLDEIAKGDPYYYLHPTNVSKDADVCSPLHSSSSSGCEFGCRGASALKWERKLVSQISSRMKSFDNVAYSLARSSGGKEVLNRKKMNSIIRKLHLVAMQLHSLVSHLYCVKGHATCKEVDSLPVALNNSHFERKMGVYKSRLKLVVPHKYQQQTQQEQHSSNKPGEELLRDTYEFFPELLLCIDIWGYNYRESLVKQHNSNSLISGKLAASGAISEAALFPFHYFRKVESLAFDFENDSNGLLHRICDELLNIVCLWNDLKWTDNFEAVALDRVVSFESNVTTSILNILELYAHHLQALWSVRLLDEPNQLRSIHFTEFNAYYSDRSQRSLNTTACSQSRAPGVLENAGDGPTCDSRTVVQHVGTEILEQRLAEEYWNRKVTALSIRNPDDEMKVGSDSKLQLLSDEAICSWDQQTLVSYLLRWSDVYAIRTEVNALSAVTNHMMKHEVQKFRFVGRDDASVTSSSYVNKTMVDSSTRQLLAAVSRAQMLIQDALVGSEKLALHSASNQLPHEKKRLKPAELEGISGNKTSSSSMEAAPFCSTSTRINDAGGAHSDDAVSETVCHAEAIASKDADSYDAIDDVNIDTGLTGEQPEVKDLIQLLAVTKQDMQELCGHRPRSARMREKVQLQSLQLARQTVEIFRNIRNMYGSQRRQHGAVR